MKKSLLILNLLWLIAAAGAFFLGRNSSPNTGPESIENLPAGTPIIGRTADPQLPPQTPLPAPAGSTTDRPALLSQDATGNPFLDGLLSSNLPVSEEQIQRGIKEAFEEKDPLKSNLMFAKLLGLLSPENAESAMIALKELPQSFSLYNQMALFQFAWGRQDGATAAQYAMDLEGRSREYSIASVMSGWATENPEEAIAWVNQLQDEGDRSQFTRGVVRGLAKSNPALATSLAIDASTNGDRRAGEYITTIAREQFRGGIDSAASWVATLPTENALRETALEQVAESYVNQDPAVAATWVEDYVGTGYGARAIGEVADEWAEKDPVAAVNWVNTLPLGDERARAYREAVWEWTGRDPFAAAEYLTQMPAGNDRDAAVTSLSKRHVNSDPESAIAWAQSIGDSQLRLDTLTSTGQAWMRRDPAGASTWLQASGLPQEVQQKIANPPREENRYRR
jgi:hypothetical protein